MKKLLLIIAFLISGVMLNAQEPKFVSTEVQNRNVIIEAFTGRGEPNCPDAQKLLNEIINENSRNLWAVNIHYGWLEWVSPTDYPNLNTSIGDQIFNGFGVWGIPSVFINRSTDAPLGIGPYVDNRDIVDQQLNQKAEVNVAGKVNVNAITRVANVEVEVYYTGNSTSSENYLTVIMLQDSIMGSQSGASSNPEQLVDGQYCHMYVLRDIVTDTWGDKIFPTTSGTLLTKKYTYEIPEVIGDPNGVEVDLDNISFVAFVTESHNGEVSKKILNANKLLYVSQHWKPNTNVYSHSMVVTADVQLDGVSKNDYEIEIGAFCGDELRGSATLQHFEGVDKFLYQFLVYGDPDDVITFKLYDHNKNKEVDYMSYEEIVFSNNAVHGTLNEPKTINFVPKHKVDVLSNGQGGEVYGTGYYNNNEVVTISANPYFGYAFVNWTVNGEIVSTEKELTITVTEDIVYTANFEEAHSVILKNGWNWYSTYVDINGEDGLNFMKKELSGVADMFKGKSKFCTYLYENNLWVGDLMSTSTEEMYMIHLESDDYTFSVAGEPVNPEDYPIELNTNWNWMAYPVNFNLSVNEAFVNHTPSHGDMLKSQAQVCQYFEGVGWMGELNTMEPGKGYMYLSNAQENITFTYPNTKTRRGVEIVRNAEKYWSVDETKYSTNMNVIAIVMQNGKEVRECEVGAFCDDECRGSARPMYIEQLDRHILFLTIHGEGGENLKFKYYDTKTEEVSDLLNEMTYKVDEVKGDASNPYIFGNNISDINAVGEVVLNGANLYPNPVNDKLYIETDVEVKEVVVCDIYGRRQVIEIPSRQDNLVIDVANLNSGVYFVMIKTNDGVVTKRFVKE